MAKDIQIDRGISDIVGCLKDPIIVFPGGWGDSLPEWLKTSITLERLVENMKALKGGKMTGTDAEACAYLFTANLSQPPNHDWAQISLYISTKVYEKWRTKESGGKMPEDVRVESLDDYQMGKLNSLKAWLYKRRIAARLDHARDYRRQKKEEAVARREQEQPALFDFK